MQTIAKRAQRVYGETKGIWSLSSEGGGTMGRPDRIVAVFLLAALAVSFAAPQPAHAFSGLEIASIVISGAMAITLAVKAVVKLFKSEETDETDKKEATDKPPDGATAKPPPITVSPDQIFEN